MKPTEQDWVDYNAKVAKHEQYCQSQELHFQRALYTIQPLVTPEQYSLIERALKNEMSMTRFMDAPNKPGYEYANND